MCQRLLLAEISQSQPAQLVNQTGIRNTTTLHELGLPLGLCHKLSAQYFKVFTSASTPIVKTLSLDLNKCLPYPQAKKRLNAIGLSRWLPAGSS